MDSDGADGIASEVIADDTDAPVAIEIARTDARRLEAFSDGVFAIAMTLLVLNLSITKGLTDGEIGRAHV